MGSESTTQRRRPRRLAAENGYDGSLSSGDDEKDNNRQRFRRRRRRTVDLTETRSSENSFPFLFLRVAIVVALLMLMVGTAYRWLFPATETPELLDDDYDSKNFQISSDSAKHKTKSLVRDTNHPQLEFPNMEDSAHETLQERIPPLPVWKLAEYSLKYDAYALAETYESSPSSFDGEDLTTVTNKQNFMFWQVAAGLRKRFSALYGGENAARAMLERGTTVFGRVNENNALPDDLHLTACRILQAKQEQRSFKFSFGGYSVTAGRGNLFQQSFPFVMEQQLHTPFRLLGVELSVRNAAMYVVGR